MKLAQDGLDYELKKKFEGMKFRDLFDLSTRATRYEAILQEGQNIKHQALGTYYQDIEGDIEVDVAQVIGKNPIVCDTLKEIEKPVNLPSSQPNRKTKKSSYRQYSFDISKAEELFDELMKQKFLVLGNGRIIPPEYERKGKDYCKWHNTYSHTTNNCITFRNNVQDLISKGLLQYSKAEKEVMGVDADPFPNMDVNVITASRPSRWFEEV